MAPEVLGKLCLPVHAGSVPLRLRPRTAWERHAASVSIGRLHAWHLLASPMHGPEPLPGVQQQCSGQLLAVDFKHNSAPNGGACFLNNFASLLSMSSNFTSNTANASAPALQLQSIVNATVTGNIFNGCAWPRPAGSWLGMALRCLLHSCLVAACGLVAPGPEEAIGVSALHSQAAGVGTSP